MKLKDKCKKNWMQTFYIFDIQFIILDIRWKHYEIVAESVDAMVALDYVRRNHMDILPSYNKRNN